MTVSFASTSSPRGIDHSNHFFAWGVARAVSFNTERLSRKSDARRRIEIFERLQNHAQPDVFKPKVIYDSDAIAYSSRVLPFGNAATFDVNMSDRAPREGAAQSRGIFRITLKRVDAAPVSFEDLQHLIDGRTTQLTSRADVALTLVQLIVRQAPNLKYPNNVKAFFCREAGSRALGGGLEVFRGYYQSVRPTLRTLLVNIDTTCGVIYQEGPMPEVALNFLGSTHPRDLNLSERDPKLAKLKKFFSGIFITFTHRKNKKKIQSIIPQAGSQKFEWNKDKNEGVVQTTTVQAYFREAYNITLRYPDAIGVKIGGGSIVPIELCVIAPDQRFTRKLPQELTKKMVEFTSDKPKARLESIRRGIVGAGAALDYATSPFVRDAEMEVSTTPTMIDGKVLSTPEMQYKRGTQVPRFGAWNVMNQQFREPQNIACWAVVDYGHPKDKPANERFVRMISENCQKLAAKKAAAAHNVGQPDLIVVILPSSAAEIRFDVKRYGDVLHGRVDKVARANDQYCNNVAMKINAKLGGVNTVPNASVLMNLAKSAYMIMGADVGHPAPGVFDQPSVASLVASYDRQAMKYHAYTTIQPPRMETIEQLQHMIFRALDDFGQEHRKAPEKIIFFRDGLSEGEYRGVAEKEFKDIKDAIERVWKERGLPPQAKRPAVTFIVVGSGFHLAFISRCTHGPYRRDADRSGNCPAGFVADEGIGNPIAKDYYLLSHGGLLGTSRPSHYIVIQDENFSNNKEVLQELSFALCHAYARATRSVSIPAPLVCGRANFHFAPELKYDDSSASVTSGKSNFNIERWRSGFQGAHSNMSKKMFYM
ncbi:Piwi domain-containing protein [Boletus reticuloceps]|uniref:Piwi domain-containing protein n=1 Tax=Boletus reticuloceps TaxID=495285 RepID=A0A8I2YTQ2_9AGAM|nr:Piwi domain-containing protein [Boletus reticuloceps]